jgi:polysaccharide deacetylase family protein (PEP-CTERM system associated)
MNALSVDVEEYYHGMEFEAALGEKRAQLESRVELSVDRVLELFEARQVKATFFIVGKVAEDHPAMVRRIHALGHEVACHSYAHELVYRQSPEGFRADVRRAKSLLEDLTGGSVIGFRAPNYSIGVEQAWAYDVLLDEGFRYDSSIYPIRHDRYGQPDSPRFPYTIRRRGDHALLEFPIGTYRVMGVNLPVGGGGYFRLLPEPWVRRGIRRVNESERQGLMFYFHPWELDPGQPRPAMPLAHRFRHYVNLDRMADKLDALMGALPFAPAKDVLGLA